MTMRQTIAVVAKLEERRTIRRYAIAGAVAALNYIEPALTQDLDILISTADLEQRGSGLILLAPIEEALQEMGYTERSDAGIVIAGWPVQFLPVASPLDEEALNQAVEVDVAAPGEPALKARCLRAEHVVATAVKLGRLKDLARVEEFLKQDAVDLAALQGVLLRHGLVDQWKSVCQRIGIESPLA